MTDMSTDTRRTPAPRAPLTAGSLRVILEWTYRRQYAWVQVWQHIPAQHVSPLGLVASSADKERLVQRWFWDYMKVWQCIQDNQGADGRTAAEACVQAEQQTMHLLMGGVINNKFWT